MSIGLRQPPPAPTVRFLLIPVLGAVVEHRRVMIKPDSKRPYNWLTRNIRPFFDEPFERVNVLYMGEYRDMFVGETSAFNGRHIRNIRATEIYRNNALSNGWHRDPEEMPAVSGPAILFPDYQVWR